MDSVNSENEEIDPFPYIQTNTGFSDFFHTIFKSGRFPYYKEYNKGKPKDSNTETPKTEKSQPKQIGSTPNGVAVMQDNEGIYVVMPDGTKRYKGTK